MKRRTRAGKVYTTLARARICAHMLIRRTLREGSVYNTCEHQTRSGSVYNTFNHENTIWKCIQHFRSRKT